MMVVLKGVEGQFPEVRILSMAATAKQTRESTNNKTTQPIGGFLPLFSFQLVCGVVWAPPTYRGIRSSGPRLSTSDGRDGEMILLVIR